MHFFKILPIWVELIVLDTSQWKLSNVNRTIWVFPSFTIFNTKGAKKAILSSTVLKFWFIVNFLFKIFHSFLKFLLLRAFKIVAGNVFYHLPFSRKKSSNGAKNGKASMIGNLEWHVTSLKKLMGNTNITTIKKPHCVSKD